MAQTPEQVEVFVSGRDGYHTYRIPAIVVTREGKLLAICEGRKNSSGDHGDICLLLKGSTDGGRTWGEQQVIYADPSEEDVTIGNPCPVVDQDTGAIWLSFCRDNNDVFMTHSEDEGESWSAPLDITGEVKKPDWTWYATGPVNGIQLRGGPNRGRLVMPCDHRVKGAGEWRESGRSHVIYSDDHGVTWRLGDATDWGMNECTVVELTDGTVMLNIRSYRGKGQRAVALSEDGGVSWSECVDDPTLVEPVCQAGILRHTWADDRGGRSRILFCNPAGNERAKMTVRLSYDEGQTWPVAKLLNAGPSAYSCLVALPDGTIGCLYETGKERAYETITFARFTLDWLTDGKDGLGAE